MDAGVVLTEVALPGGGRMLVQAVDVASVTGTAAGSAEDPFEGPVDEEVGLLTHGLGQVTEALGSFAESVTHALSRAQPHRVTVEFGCQLGLEPGGLIALITKAGVDANLKVTLEWDRTTAHAGDGAVSATN